ncbi:hypothetical protein HanPSC8_Chr10g0429341 [Helianthus annuus]|nr:hypothetical protein HanPSC8_Chr10g0429341 [Helianthus annuus]
MEKGRQRQSATTVGPVTKITVNGGGAELVNTPNFFCFRACFFLLFRTLVSAQTWIPATVVVSPDETSG